MIYVALAALAVALAAILTGERRLLREQRNHARAEGAWQLERARLIDQMCNLAGKPWSPPPARAAAPPLSPEAERPPDPDARLAVW